MDVEGYGTKWTPWIFPLGSPHGTQADILEDQTALDGHVVLVTGDTEASFQMAIANYSIGGSPGESGYPVGPNPLPSGSTDGNAMLFFWDNAKKKIAYRSLYPPSMPSTLELQYEQFRIVTVTNPINNAPPPDGYEPCSYAFSLTSSQSFELLLAGKTLSDGSVTADLHPTLVLYYDDEITGDPSKLEIGRYDAGKWQIIDAPGTKDRDLYRHLVALTLSSKTAPGLFRDSPTAEHFRLFLPQISPAAGAHVAEAAAYSSQKTE
jgi:hypothetical protein